MSYKLQASSTERRWMKPQPGDQCLGPQDCEWWGSRRPGALGSSRWKSAQCDFRLPAWGRLRVPGEKLGFTPSLWLTLICPWQICIHLSHTHTHTHTHMHAQSRSPKCSHPHVHAPIRLPCSDSCVHTHIFTHVVIAYSNFHIHTLIHLHTYLHTLKRIH